MVADAKGLMEGCDKQSRFTSDWTRVESMAMCIVKSSPVAPEESSFLNAWHTVLGPSHVPTGLPKVDPVWAIWWRENGAELRSANRETIFK